MTKFYLKEVRALMRILVHGIWEMFGIPVECFFFLSAIAFNQSLRHWNVRKCYEHARYVLPNALSFNQPIGEWDVSNVTDMRFLFQNAKSFHQPIESWDVKNVLSYDCDVFLV
jgi:MoxR-like ATPase